MLTQVAVLQVSGLFFGELSLKSLLSYWSQESQHLQVLNLHIEKTYLRRNYAIIITSIFLANLPWISLQ